MDFSRFFIDRPIFAAVLSIMIFAAGLIAIPILPVGEYPEVVPPSVVVRTVYPGANPKVIAETVATPLEEAINGVEGMMYLKSVAGSDGVLQMTVTFRPGTDPDAAAVKVQNRVAQAQARLPEDVRRQGVTTQKQSPTFLMVVHLTSPGGKYDTLYLRNYARLHVKDALARIPGVGDAQIFGGGDYAMRAWLDPGKVAARGLTQLRIAETEKYAHVTFFLNGGRETQFAGEDRILVPSPKVATYDLKPDMSAGEVTDKLEAAILSGQYDLIVCNYANPDMVGHTGIMGAALTAVETIDAALGRLRAAIEKVGGVMLVTADHGNIEMMEDPATKEPLTSHTTLDVPVIVVNGPRATLENGRLADVAPTMLDLMGLPAPAAMTGHSLLRREA